MKTLWRAAAALCIAHVALMLGGFTQQHRALLGADPAHLTTAFAKGTITSTFVGGYISLLGFFAFLLLVPLLARLLRGASEPAGWFAGAVSATGITYVAVTLATSFAAAGAAFYSARHGVDLGAVAAVNNLGELASDLGSAVLALFTVTVGAAVLASRALPRWLGWSGVVVGVGYLGAVAGAGLGLADYGMLIWMVWFVVAAVGMLRQAGRAPVVVSSPAQPLVTAAR